MLANPKRTKDEIVQWIRSYFESNGPGCDAVVGISGGKDSSVVAALCVEALGKERVVGVMMPNGEQPDLDDSKQLIEFLGIRYAYTDISKAVSAVSDQVALNMNVSDQTRILKYDVIVTVVKDRMFGRQNIDVGLYYDPASRRFFSDMDEYDRRFSWDKKEYKEPLPLPPQLLAEERASEDEAFGAVNDREG